MKNKISYIIMSLIFFNLLFVFYFYFKIVNFLYIDFVGVNTFVNVLVSNLVIVVLDALYIVLYRLIKLEKLSYFWTSFIGVITGFLFSFLLLRFKEYEVIDYLGIVSFFTINTLFISYSLYFEKEKELVFK